MLGEPDHEAGRKQLARDDLVLIALAEEVVLLAERCRLELDLLELVLGEPVRVRVEVVEEAALALQVDALEAPHAELTEVDHRDRELEGLPGLPIRLAALVANLVRVPADPGAAAV